MPMSKLRQRIAVGLASLGMVAGIGMTSVAAAPAAEAATWGYWQPGVVRMTYCYRVYDQYIARFSQSCIITWDMFRKIYHQERDGRHYRYCFYNPRNAADISYCTSWER